MYYNPSCNIFITVWLKKIIFSIKTKNIGGKRFVCQIAIIENLECRAAYLMVISWGSSIKNIIFTSFRYIFRKLHQYYYFCMHLWFFFHFFFAVLFGQFDVFYLLKIFFFVKIRLLTKHKNVPNCFASEIPRSFVQNLKNLY